MGTAIVKRRRMISFSIILPSSKAVPHHQDPTWIWTSGNLWWVRVHSRTQTLALPSFVNCLMRHRIKLCVVFVRAATAPIRMCTTSDTLPFQQIWTYWNILKVNGSENNLMGTDFDLYSTYDHALSGEEYDKWRYCNYDYAEVGFPRDCGKYGYTGCQWNSFKRNGCYAWDVAFFVEKATE